MEDVFGAVLAGLARMGISFELLRHEPVHSIEECLAPAQALHGLVPRNLFLTPRSRGAYYLCLMRPDALFRTSSVSRQAGSARLSFAQEDELLRLMRVKPGAVTPMSLMFDSAREVRLLVDQRLRAEKRLVFHPCVNTASLAMSGEDFFDKFLPMTGHDVTWIEVTE